MRIVHLIQGFKIGGAECLALDLCRVQRRLGHQVACWALKPECDRAFYDEFVAAGIAAQIISRAREGFDPSLYPRLAYRFMRWRADVVHTHDPQSLCYAAGPARLLPGVAVVHTKHGLDAPSGRALRLVQASGRFVQAFVAVSAEAARVALQGREVAAHKVSTIDNGVDCLRFHPDPLRRRVARESLGLTEAQTLVLAVGRLEPVKDHLRLLRLAMPLLGENVKLAIVGDGSLRAELEAVAARAIPGSVMLLGARRDIPELLLASDLFCISSKSEGLPLSLLEAMASGVCVLCTPVGAIPSVLGDGLFGALAASDQSYRAELERLTADRQQRQRLAEAGRQRARCDFSLEQTAKQYLGLYQRVLVS